MIIHTYYKIYKIQEVTTDEAKKKDKAVFYRELRSRVVPKVTTFYDAEVGLIQETKLIGITENINSDIEDGFIIYYKNKYYEITTVSPREKHIEFTLQNLKKEVELP